MDESGGSRQPRSQNDESTERPTAPTDPSADRPRPHPTPSPDPDRDKRPDNGTGRSDNAESTPEPEAPEPEAPEPEAPKSGAPETEAPETDIAETHAEPDVPAPDAPDPDAAATTPTATPTDATGSTDNGTDRTDQRAEPAPPAATPTDTPAPARLSKTPEPPKPPESHGPPLAHTPSTPPPKPTPHPHDGHDTHPDRPLAHSGMARTQPPKRPKDPGGGLLMGRPFGVPVYVAPSWFLVAALITWVFGGQLDRVLPELGAARYLVALFFAVAFYASVLVHELAHTVAAIRYKLPVRRIQLQFFGGVSEIEKEAETPGREFVLAFVGPLLSLVLGGVFYLAMQLVEPGTVPGVLLAGLMISNLIVAAFNLLPGLPLDGGRMLRAVVWKITGRPMSGTVAAAWVGRALAVAVLIGLPLLTQSGLLGSSAADNVGMDTVMDALLAAILAAIIWTGAGNSLRVARLREHLPELRARALTRRAVPVQSDTPLSEALRRANASGARALVVVDGDGHPVSLVREAAIVGVPEHRRPWVPVSGLAQDLTDGMRVSAELAGEDLLEVLRATPATEYLVVEDTGEIYGVLSAADVERAFVKAMARPS
ncbi:site-2 protease family protein [Streptomyces sp. NPDC059477]|uniref:site-2 protease family protein n=1 Tax=Streptomyces sp. NPDC059477 TaxID=3346847 RepID=UPI003678D442